MVLPYRDALAPLLVPLAKWVMIMRVTLLLILRVRITPL